jgi:hypothetical protein
LVQNIKISKSSSRELLFFKNFPERRRLEYGRYYQKRCDSYISRNFSPSSAEELHKVLNLMNGEATINRDTSQITLNGPQNLPQSNLADETLKLLRSLKAGSARRLAFNQSLAKLYRNTLLLSDDGPEESPSVNPYATELKSCYHKVFEKILAPLMEGLSSDKFIRLLEVVPPEQEQRVLEKFLSYQRPYSKVETYVSLCRENKEQLAQSVLIKERGLFGKDLGVWSGSSKIFQSIPEENQLALVQAIIKEDEDATKNSKFLTREINMSLLNKMSSNEAKNTLAEYFTSKLPDHANYLRDADEPHLTEESSLNNGEFFMIKAFLKRRNFAKISDFSDMISGDNLSIKKRILALIALKKVSDFSLKNIILEVLKMEDIPRGAPNLIHRNQSQILELLLAMGEDTQNKIISPKQTSKIITSLYPSESLRCNFLKHATFFDCKLSRSYSYPYPNKSIPKKSTLLQLARATAHAITSPQNLESLSEHLRLNKIIKDEKGKLDLIKGYYKKSFKAINSFLERTSLKEEGVLTEEGKEHLAGLFGKRFELKNYNLSDIFSYFYLSKNFDFFNKILNPAFKEKSQKEDLKLPDDVSYFLKPDYQALQIICTNLDLPKVEPLADFLLNEKIQIPAVNSATAEINFNEMVDVNSGDDANANNSFSTSRKDQITAQFKSLLESEPSKEAVIDFFSNFYSPEDFRSISDFNKTKIYETFKNQKNEFAFIFSKKGALASFIAEVSSVEDGCVRNIGTKFESMLSQHLIEDKISGIIYGCYLTNILLPIGQMPTSIVGDVTHGGDANKDSALQNSIINEQTLNLPGFINGVEKCISENLGQNHSVQHKLALELLSKNVDLKRYLNGEDETLAAKVLMSVLAERESILQKYEGDLNPQLAHYACRDFLEKSSLSKHPSIKDKVDNEGFLKNLTGVMTEASTTEEESFLEEFKTEFKKLKPELIPSTRPTRSSKMIPRSFRKAKAQVSIV